VARSAAWYRQLLDLRLWAEIVEDGTLRGASLIDPQGRFDIALRDRSVCANQPDLSGFDIALAPTSRSVLEAIVARCHLLGIFYHGIQDTRRPP
jgi:hypothetical protein